MGRLRWVQEPGCGARTRQRRCNLAADDAGFAHAGNDDATAAIVEKPDGMLEFLVDAVDETQDGSGLRAEDRACQFEPGSSVGRHVELLVRLKPETTSLSVRLKPEPT